MGKVYQCIAIVWRDDIRMSCDMVEALVYADGKDEAYRDFLAKWEAEKGEGASPLMDVSVHEIYVGRLSSGQLD